MNATLIDIRNTKWDKIRRVYPDDSSILYTKPLNNYDLRKISITLMNMGINRGYVWMIGFDAGDYTRTYKIEDRDAAIEFVRAHKNDPKYWARLPVAETGEKMYRDIPFRVVRDNGTEYYQAHITGRLGTMWFTKEELDSSLARAERLKKKYGWS